MTLEISFLKQCHGPAARSSYSLRRGRTIQVSVRHKYTMDSICRPILMINLTYVGRSWSRFSTVCLQYSQGCYKEKSSHKHMLAEISSSCPLSQRLWGSSSWRPCRPGFPSWLLVPEESRTSSPKSNREAQATCTTPETLTTA